MVMRCVRGDAGRSTWSEERRKYGECERWCFAFKNFQTRLKHRGHLCVPVLSLSHCLIVVF